MFLWAFAVIALAAIPATIWVREIIRNEIAPDCDFSDHPLFRKGPYVYGKSG